ncbi:MAG: alanine--tRNA ligase [Chloroflexota bacterium]|nr:alanine--tRNA ligase [Chloroflexota bacterium]MDQ5865418.1 alanine--tRNA ligase [Chloroflexota bacterium]
MTQLDDQIRSSQSEFPNPAYMSSGEIRDRFIRYFVEKVGSTHVPSSSLVPSNDPTLLFTTAGMVQFKDVFLGNETRPYTRAVTSQKVMRAGGKHNDLENVGPSIRHQTFFEMLGNFSFGDYFKREAITYAWDLLTTPQEQGGFGLDPNRLWPTIYLDDEESFELWQEVAGVPPQRITRLGKEDNFWAMGDTGPCGPNTEIYWDFYPERGEDGDNPGTNEARFFEIWNLVFMQFDQPGDGTLVPLEHPGVDTGMGFERMSTVMQSVPSSYETDLFTYILDKVQELTGQTHEERERNIISYRVVADHTRAATFLIGEGVLPGNTLREYVLRRVMRRAMVHARRLGLTEPFMGRIADVIIENMGEVYPEIRQRRDFILEALRREEESFARTIIAGLNQFEQIVNRLALKPGEVFPGREMFELYGTHGLSKDIMKDEAVSRGLEIDEAGFEEALQEEQQRSKRSTILKAGDRQNLDIYQQAAGKQPTTFLGYDYATLDNGYGSPSSRVLGIIVQDDGRQTTDDRQENGNPPSSIVHRPSSLVDLAGEGNEVEVVLDQTPFYAESGGQVADKGTLTWEGGRMEVTDVQRPVGGVIVHRGRIVEGTLRTGAEVQAHIPGSTRWSTMRNHTATHLLHKALRDVLGTHVHQKGSVVEPGRLRFDFSHNAPMSQEELLTVERIVNEQIRADYPVQTAELALKEAIAQGAMALFGEKYGDVVRLVRIPGYESKELCGGTHVERTGQIGPFFITYEGSIGQGVRRIEAVTGEAAVEYAQERRAMLNNVASRLGAGGNVGRSLELVDSLQAQLRESHRRIEDLERRIARGETGGMTQQVQEVGGVKVLTARTTASSMDALRETGDHLRDQLGSGVVVLGTVIDDEPKLLAMVTKDVVERGVRAGDIIKEITPTIGGRGGGAPHMAQGGGKDPSGLDAALAQVVPFVAAKLGQ